MYPHRHAHKYSQEHTHMRTHSCTRTHTHTHRRKHTHTLIYTHAFALTHTLTCTHRDTHSCTHMHAHAHTLMHMHTHTHSHPHGTHTNTWHTHSCTHTHAHTCQWQFALQRFQGGGSWMEGGRDWGRSCSHVTGRAACRHSLFPCAPTWQAGQRERRALSPLAGLLARKAQKISAHGAEKMGILTFEG